MRIAAYALALSLGFATPASLAAPEAPGRVVPAQTLAYGSDRLQRLDHYPARRASSLARAPAVIFVHGGGWSRGDKVTGARGHKTPHLTGLGYHFISIDYRLVPKVTVEAQAADVAAAVAHVVRNAGRLGIDPARIVLSGHSAGAHLVALVGTDPEYLRAAGLRPGDLKGVMPIDGAGYDIAKQMRSGERALRKTYLAAFGTDPQRHRALSPVAHAAAPNAPAFLVLHAEREASVAQAHDLAAALRRAGTPVELAQSPGAGLKGHIEANTRLGDPSFPTTPIMDRWLARLFAPPRS
jgi:arylformamidase